MTKPKAKTIVIISLLAAIAIVLVFLLRGCKATDYSVEEHVERISERVQERYMGENSEYTGFTVHPLYDADDNFANVCVVDFEPHGFLYIVIRDLRPLPQLLGMHGMYSVASVSNMEWYRYRLSKEESMPASQGRRWEILRNSYGGEILDYQRGENHSFFEVDETGQRVGIKDSHYKGIAEGNERRYILEMSDGDIPAVKRDGKFFNVISLEAFDFNPKSDNYHDPCTWVYAEPYRRSDL